MKRLMIWMPALAILVVAMLAATGGGVESAHGDVHISAPQWNDAHN